ncbi:FAD-dependent oxidoreductase [Rickettsiales bacterium]|nr:FAD-dependent oxidoreductase [Rickettsiales bacterium]
MPLKPLKGYSFNCKKLKLEKCIIDHDSKIVLTPFDGFVRVSGLYDFVGFNNKIIKNRLNFIKTRLNNLFDEEINITDYQNIWCGFRPISSDRLPIIGNSNIYDNLYYNMGHANLGFTLSAGSASALLKNLSSNINVIESSFNAKRYKLI